MPNSDFTLSERMLLITATGTMAKMYAEFADNDTFSAALRASFALQSVSYQMLKSKLEDGVKEWQP